MGASKSSFAEVATFRQRSLSGSWTGFAALLAYGGHYRALAGAATIPGDRPVRPEFERSWPRARGQSNGECMRGGGSGRGDVGRSREPDPLSPVSACPSVVLGRPNTRRRLGRSRRCIRPVLLKPQNSGGELRLPGCGPVAVGAMRLELFRDFPIRRITVARDDDVRFATR
jgi:hypothetical protein